VIGPIGILARFARCAVRDRKLYFASGVTVDKETRAVGEFNKDLLDSVSPYLPHDFALKKRGGFPRFVFQILTSHAVNYQCRPEGLHYDVKSA
jgi:hypothetical protein